MKRSRIARAAAALALCMLTLSVTALAEEAPDEDLYVMNFAGVDIPDYDFDQVYLYPSPHYSDLVVTRADGAAERWNYTGQKVMNMINTALIPLGGEGAYASVPVYCLDALTTAQHGHAYRCMNLEQSSYFSAETAGRLRAVLASVFPYERDVAALALRVNRWLFQTDGESYTPVTALTETECITVAQCVIWRIVNGVEILAPYAGTVHDRFSPEQCVYYAWLAQPAGEHTAANCDALTRYLLALPAAPAADPLITDAALSNARAVLTPRTDGTYDAAVSVTVNATPAEGSALTLRALCAGREITTAYITGRRDYTLHIAGLADPPAEIRIVLEGTQTAEDAFLFHPLGGRDASQTMGAYARMTVPVRASAVASVTIGDPAVIPATGDPLPPALLPLLLMSGAALAITLRLRR